MMISYEFKLSYDDPEQELEFICKQDGCEQTIKVSDLSEHAVSAHGSSQYKTNMVVRP